ncbi:zona pellucida sperm-binding protein 1-like [Arapaima gigas]
MALLAKSLYLLLLLIWACGDLAVTEQFDNTHDFRRRFDGAFYSLPEDHNDEPLFYPPYNDGSFEYYGNESGVQLNYDFPDNYEYFLDTEADVEFEHVVEPSRIDEMSNFTKQRGPLDSLVVLCSEKQMKVTLPAGPVEEIHILGLKGSMPVLEAPKSCGYSIRKGLAHNMLTIPFRSCHVMVKDGHYDVGLTYPIADGQKGIVTLSCPRSSHLPDSPPNVWNAQSDEAASEGSRGISPFALKHNAANIHSKSRHPTSGNPRLSGPPVKSRIPCSSFRPSSGFPIKGRDLCASTRSSPLKGAQPGSGTRGSPVPIVKGGTRGSPTRGGQPGSGTLGFPVKGGRPGSSVRVGQPGSGTLGFPVKGGWPGFLNSYTGCNILQSKYVQCGPPKTSPSLCLARGCCVDRQTSTCFYPMDECTADKNFVFAVYYNDTTFPVDPTSLIVAGKGSCTPVIKTEDFAIFKFSVNDCGTRTYEVGQTVVYLAEVQTSVRVYNLKYGAISRDNPLRLLVECRYLKSGVGDANLVSVGYMVMSPSLPPTVVSGGLFGVQLRIAADRTYTKFYPHYHRPLRLLLGKSVFLELRLMDPNPAAVLLVNYCLAYPRSAKNALVLLYEGCPNPLDGAPTSVLYAKDLPQSKHKRRFEIKTFQFMDLKFKKYLDEEIYFMCSTEVCLPSEKKCVEGCFGHVSIEGFLNRCVVHCIPCNGAICLSGSTSDFTGSAGMGPTIQILITKRAQD